MPRTRNAGGSESRSSPTVIHLPPVTREEEEALVKRYTEKMKSLLSSTTDLVADSNGDAAANNGGLGLFSNKWMDNLYSAHKKRVQNILDQGKFLKATEWMYRPIEDYLSTDRSIVLTRSNNFSEDDIRRVGDQCGYPHVGVFNPPDDIDLGLDQFSAGNLAERIPVTLDSSTTDNPPENVNENSRSNNIENTNPIVNNSDVVVVVNNTEDDFSHLIEEHIVYN